MTLFSSHFTSALRTHLPACQNAGGQRWCAEDPAALTRAVEAASHLRDPASLPEDRIYKREVDRLIFRLPGDPGQPEWVAKFVLGRRSVHQWLLGGRPSREADNLLEARRRGLGVPRVHAAGVLRRAFCADTIGVMIEHLPGVSMRDRFLARPGADESLSLLRRATPLLCDLYRKGCNHIDLGPHAILLADDPQRDMLIDFEQVAFFERPNPASLAFQAGYFAWAVATNRDWVSYEIVEDWFSEVLQACDLASSGMVWRVWKDAVAARRSVRARLAIR